VAALAAADIFVYNGAGFERWQRRLARQLPARVVRVQATANVPLRRLVEERAGHGSHENGAGEPDPHVWLDPVLAQRQVDNVLAGFVRADRGGSAMYAASARRLRQDLSDLHRRFEARLGTCRQRHFITTHAAFGYLAARYRLTMIAVAGIAPEAEPSPRKLQELVREARSRGVGAVFSESAADPKVAEVLAREIGARTLTLSPLEYLTREQRRAGATYFTVMDENLRNLADGLGCR
jgi:zinc transport system substrate-binding protein